MNKREEIHDQWLVSRCQEGDVAALEELITRWQERLWRHSLRLTGDSEAAWDILQETMLQVSQRIGQLADAAAFPGWAYRIATNRCRDFFRKRRRYQQSIEAYMEQQTTVSVHRPESAMELEDALKALPGPQQTLLSLRYEEGFSVAEIAGILGIQTGTVKSRLYTAREQLRLLLEEQRT